MLQLFQVFQAGSALPCIGERLAKAGDDPASFEMAMAHEDARLMTGTAGEDPLFVLPAAIAAMDHAIAKGLGSADFATFTKP